MDYFPTPAVFKNSTGTNNSPGDYFYRLIQKSMLQNQLIKQQASLSYS
jgi:hypothetical protein